MFNGVSGLHELGALVIPWVAVLLLTLGTTGGHQDIVTCLALRLKQALFSDRTANET